MKVKVKVAEGWAKTKCITTKAFKNNLVFHNTTRKSVRQLLYVQEPKNEIDINIT